MRKKTLRVALRKWMQKNGKTHTWVAVNTGKGEVNPTTIYRLLRGETKKPHPALERALWQLISSD